MVPRSDLVRAIEVILQSAKEETGEVWLWYNADGSWDVDQYDNLNYRYNCVVDDLEGATPEEIADDLLADLTIEVEADLN